MGIWRFYSALAIEYIVPGVGCCYAVSIEITICEANQILVYGLAVDRCTTINYQLALMYISNRHLYGCVVG